MKKLLFYILFVLTVLSGCGKGVSLQTDDPVEYHTFIENQQDKVSMSILNLSAALRLADKEMLEKEYEKSTQEISKALDEVERMADFKGDKTYKEAAVTMIRFYQKQISESLKEVIKLKTRGNLTVPEQLEIKNLMTVFSAQEKTVNETFLVARKTFTTQYNVPVIDN